MGRCSSGGRTIRRDSTAGKENAPRNGGKNIYESPQISAEPANEGQNKPVQKPNFQFFTATAPP